MELQLNRGALAAILLTTLVVSVQAQIPPPANPEDILSSAYTGKAYSPYAGRDFATGVYWGDTHLHTDISMDAGAFGNRLTGRVRTVKLECILCNIDTYYTNSHDNLPTRNGFSLRERQAAQNANS